MCGLQLFLAAMFVLLGLVAVLLFGIVEEESTAPTITLEGWEGLFPDIRVLEDVPTCYVSNIQGLEPLAGARSTVLFLTYTEEFAY